MRLISRNEISQQNKAIDLLTINCKIGDLVLLNHCLSKKKLLGLRQTLAEE